MSAERKRRNANIFTAVQGRGIPRQGFLSFELLRAVYLRSEIVRTCVDHIIEWVSGVEWEIGPLDDDQSRWLKKNDPDAYLEQRKRISWAKQFFAKPNGTENLDQLQRKLVRDLLVYDAAALEKVTVDWQGRQLPVELGVIPGETIEPEVDESGAVVAYWQSYNVVRNQRFERDECSYLLQHPNSWSPYGISPIETAWITILGDLEASKLNSSYFSKNGIPPALLGIQASPEEFQRLAASLRNTAQDNPHNLHLFRSLPRTDGQPQNPFQLIPLSHVSPKDMEFSQLIHLAVRRICMAYKVSPAMIGFTDDIRGGIGSGVAESQENLTKNTAIGPILRLLEDVYTNDILHEICGWQDIQFRFTQHTTPERELEYRNDMGEVQAGLMTINEFRSKWGGRKPVAWGDQPYTPTVGYQPPMSEEQMLQQMQQQAMAQQQAMEQQQMPPEAAMQKSATKKIVVKL